MVVVLARNYKQAKHFLRNELKGVDHRGVKLITSDRDIYKLQGAKIEQIYKTGTWFHSISPHALSEIESYLAWCKKSLQRRDKIA